MYRRRIAPTRLSRASARSGRLPTNWPDAFGRPRRTTTSGRSSATLPQAGPRRSSTSGPAWASFPRSRAAAARVPTTSTTWDTRPGTPVSRTPPSPSKLAVRTAGAVLRRHLARRPADRGRAGPQLRPRHQQQRPRRRPVHRRPLRSSRLPAPGRSLQRPQPARPGGQPRARGCKRDQRRRVDRGQRQRPRLRAHPTVTSGSRAWPRVRAVLESDHPRAQRGASPPEV